MPLHALPPLIVCKHFWPSYQKRALYFAINLRSPAATIKIHSSPCKRQSLGNTRRFAIDLQRPVPRSHWTAKLNDSICQASLAKITRTVSMDIFHFQKGRALWHPPSFLIFQNYSSDSSAASSLFTETTSNFVPQLGQAKFSSASISSSTQTTSPQLGQVISYRPASYSSS